MTLKSRLWSVGWLDRDRHLSDLHFVFLYRFSSDLPVEGPLNDGILIEVLTNIWCHKANVGKVYQDVTDPLHSGSLLIVSVNICLSFSDTSSGIHYLARAGLTGGWTGFRAWCSVYHSLTWHLIYLNYQYRHSGWLWWHEHLTVSIPTHCGDLAVRAVPQLYDVLVGKWRTKHVQHLTQRTFVYFLPA